MLTEPRTHWGEGVRWTLRRLAEGASLADVRAELEGVRGTVAGEWCDAVEATLEAAGPLMEGDQW